jgi:hypothetical protein
MCFLAAVDAKVIAITVIVERKRLVVEVQSAYC